MEAMARIGTRGVSQVYSPFHLAILYNICLTYIFRPQH